MITEANIAYEQNTTTVATRSVNGLGPGSFIGGQFWAETMAIGMEKGVTSLMHWSVVEGNGSDNYLTDIGLICKESTTNTASPRLRPSYYHFEVMANRFKGDFYPSTITGGNGTMKAWAAKDAEKVVVMVQNQNYTGQSYSAVPFQVRLSPTIAIAPTGTVDILINIFPNSPNAKYASTATATTLIENESTVLLTFNCVGNFGWRHDYTINHANTVPDPGFQLTETKNPSPMIAGQITTGTLHAGTPTTVQVQMNPSTFSYSWIPPVTNITIPTENSGATATLTSLNGTAAPTVYTFVATDANGCKMAEELSVFDGGIIVGNGGGSDPKVSWTQPSTCGKSDGIAWMHAGSFSNTATFSWDGATAVSTRSIGNLAPGGHYVTLYSSGTFIGTYQYIVPISGTLPAVHAGFDRWAGKLCPVNLAAVPNLSGNTYKWYTGNSTIPFSTNRTTTVTNWSGETYRVQVTDAAGCINEDRVTVNRLVHACLPAGTNAVIPCDRRFNETYRESSITTETLTGNLTISRNAFFDKVLYVPEGITLTIENCVLAFSSSAQVIVAPGGGLDVDDVYIVPCDSLLFPIFKGTGDHSNFLVRNSAFETNGTAIELDGDQGAEIEMNVFSRCGTGIKLTDCEEISVRQNAFYLGTTGISMEAPTDANSGYLESNHFIDPEIGIDIGAGDHTMLSVACNTLEYDSYGIISEGTLADFGNMSNSTANLFISSSTNTNHQFHHTGNPITYYCSQSNSFSLSPDGGCMAFVAQAQNEPSCPAYQNLRQSAPLSTLDEPEPRIAAFPNPTNGLLNVYYYVPGNPECVMYLYEAGSGKLVLSQKIPAGQFNSEIDMTNYATGVYALFIRTANGQQMNLKVINAR